MPHSDIYLSVIVPAYNEAGRLPKTLRRLQEYLSAKLFNYEIIVALGGPTDNTREVLQSMKPEIKKLKILDRKVNHGKGYTIEGGDASCFGSHAAF